jgi:hypothetical protein
MKYSINVWNQTKYLTLIFTICILALLIWYSYSNKKYQENFQQNNWVDTIKCLNLDNDDMNFFYSYLENIANGEDPKKTLNKFIQMLENKGLEYSKIMECMFTPNTKENFKNLRSL